MDEIRRAVVGKQMTDVMWAQIRHRLYSAARSIFGDDMPDIVVEEDPDNPSAVMVKVTWRQHE